MGDKKKAMMFIIPAAALVICATAFLLVFFRRSVFTENTLSIIFIFLGSLAAISLGMICYGLIRK